MTKGTEQLPALWLLQAKHYGTGPLEAHVTPTRLLTEPTDTQWMPCTPWCNRGHGIALKDLSNKP